MTASYTDHRSTTVRSQLPTKEWNLSCPIFVAFFQWVSQEWYWCVWFSSIPPPPTPHKKKKKFNIPQHIFQHTRGKFKEAWCALYPNIVLTWAERYPMPSLRCPLYTIYQKILADPKYNSNYYPHFHFQTFNHATGTKFSVNNSEKVYDRLNYLCIFSHILRKFTVLFFHS